ncbi:unnamed protein product [Rhodiola kirilowii]
MEVEKRVKPAALGSKFPLSYGEMMVASGVLLSFGVGLLVVYSTLPDSDYSFLKLPHNLEDLQILRDHLDTYTKDYTLQVLLGYCIVYIFMQTFMIPGTVFMSLLAGSSLWGFQRCRIGGIQCNSWRIFMFLLVEVDRSTSCYLNVA